MNILPENGGATPNEYGPTAVDLAVVGGFPIPMGKSVAFSDEDCTVTIIKAEDDTGIGLSLHGASDAAEDVKLDAGIFIAGVKAGFPAAKIPKLVTGMRIIKIDDTRMIRKTKKEAVAAITACGRSIKLTVKYDPRGYAVFDKGEELRRLSIYAFQHKWRGVPHQLEGTFGYHGSIVVDSVRALSLDAAQSQVKAHPAKVKSKLFFTGAALLGTKTAMGKIESKVHVLLDMESIKCYGKLVVFVSADVTKTGDGAKKRLPHCHIISCKNSRAAVDLKKRIEVARSAGMGNVRTAVNAKDVALVCPVLKEAKLLQIRGASNTKQNSLVAATAPTPVFPVTTASNPETLSAPAGAPAADFDAMRAAMQAQRPPPKEHTFTVTRLDVNDKIGMSMQRGTGWVGPGVYVRSTVEGSLARNAGIPDGCRLVKVDDTDVGDKTGFGVPSDEFGFNATTPADDFSAAKDNKDNSKIDTGKGSETFDGFDTQASREIPPSRVRTYKVTRPSATVKTGLKLKNIKGTWGTGLHIVSTVEGGPASIAGIPDNAQLVAINGTNVEGKGIKEVAPLMADVLILSLDCRVHEDAAEPPSSIDVNRATEDSSNVNAQDSSPVKLESAKSDEFPGFGGKDHVVASTPSDSPASIKPIVDPATSTVVADSTPSASELKQAAKDLPTESTTVASDVVAPAADKTNDVKDSDSLASVASAPTAQTEAAPAQEDSDDDMI